MHKLLHLLPPELAHKTTLSALGMGLGPKATNDPETMNINLFGQTASNPIGLSAGADKEGRALNGWHKMGFGFVEMGTITVKPRNGNPTPRIWRMKDGKSIVNWMGLPGPGYQVALKNLQDFRKASSAPIGVSIASPDGDMQELTYLATQFAPYATYLALNISCPNVSGHGQADDAIKNMQTQIQAVADGAGDTPIAVKFGPTKQDDVVKAMVDAALEAGVSGLIATNTIPPAENGNLITNLPDWPEHNGQKVGGYSGPALLPIATQMVKTMRSHAGPDVTIIGVGGVQSGQDAKQLLAAGANAVELYTALTRQGPKIIDDIKQAIG